MASFKVVKLRFGVELERPIFSKVLGILPLTSLKFLGRCHGTN